MLRPDQGDSGQLEDLLKNVEEIVKGALHKAKSALRDAKDITEDNLGISVEDVAKGGPGQGGPGLPEARDMVGSAVSSREAADQAGDTMPPGDKSAWHSDDRKSEVHFDEYDD